MTVSFIGGDGRALRCARLFEGIGATVTAIGIPTLPTSPLSTLSSADAVILPLPLTRDGVHPTTAAAETTPSFSEIFAAVGDKTLLLGGMIPPALIAAAEAAGVRLIDYYRDDELLWKNAVATAEAAVAMAALDLPVTLRGAAVAVVGSGRIARALCGILAALGAQVSVWARNPVSLAALTAGGIDPHLFGEDRPLCLAGSARAVFSTVPAPVLDRQALAALAPGTPVYDLGGGGVCSETAEALGLFLPDCRSLPGRYSPESSADYLFSAIRRYLLQEGGMAV